LLSAKSQSDPIERARDLAVLHEPAPNISAAHVLRAQQNDSRVNADYVRIDPIGLRIEGVDKAILPIDPRAILLVHRPQRRLSELRREHQRTTRRRRYDGAIDIGIAWWPAPRQVTLRTVGRSNAPDVRAKSRELVRQVHAKGAMRERRLNRVLKIVDAVASDLPAIAIVDPGVRILMHEQRHADRGEISVTFVTIPVPPERIP
jgi:hypothetical protein